MLDLADMADDTVSISHTLSETQTTQTDAKIMQSKLIGTVVLETAVKYLMMVANGKQNEIVLHRDGTLTYAVDGKWQGMPAANGPAKYDECKTAAQARGVDVVEVVC